MAGTKALDRPKCPRCSEGIDELILRDITASWPDKIQDNRGDRDQVEPTYVYVCPHCNTIISIVRDHRLDR